jgi:hypothetical protein
MSSKKLVIYLMAEPETPSRSPTRSLTGRSSAARASAR